MPFNGSGTFTSLYSWVQDAANGIDISSTRMDAQEADYTTNGFGNCLTRDGQGSASADLPMNTHKHTGVGDASAVDQYPSVLQIKKGALVYAGTAGGTVDALTGTTSPAITALTNGMQVIIKAAGANTSTAPTFVLDGVGSALAITKNGGQLLAAGDIFGAGHMLELVYSSTGTRWEFLNPASQLGASTGTGAFVRQVSPSITTPTLTGAVEASGTLGVGVAPGAATLTTLTASAGSGFDVLGRTSDDQTGVRFMDHTGANAWAELISTSSGDFKVYTSTTPTLALSINSSQVTDFAHVPTVGGVPISTGGTRATSTDTAVTSAGTWTFTHSLGALPDSIKYYLVCQSNDAGYTAGQIIDVVPSGTNTGTTNQGFSAIVSTSAIVIRYANGVGGGSTVFLVTDAGSSGHGVDLTNANWKMRIVASLVS